MVVYEPRGRAREYAGLAVNLYAGCSHGCKYCYAPLALKRDREKYHVEVVPRKDIIKQLEADCRKMANGKHQRVLMSFTTDPYHQENEKYGLTRQAIKILHESGLCVQILTKGGTRACKDFDLLGEQDAFASTLTFVDEKDSLKWEPNAALPEDRLKAMKKAHEIGIPTWASLEPVIDPEQSLQLIRLTHNFVDLYKVGTLNYSPIAKEIDWIKFAKEAKRLLELYGKDYYFKHDLCLKAGMKHIEQEETARKYISETSAQKELTEALF